MRRLAEENELAKVGQNERHWVASVFFDASQWRRSLTMDIVPRCVSYNIYLCTCGDQSGVNIDPVGEVPRIL